jgi:hypothetical protein
MWKTVAFVVALLVAAPGHAVGAPGEGAGTSCRTVYPSGRFMRVIETAKAKASPIPIVIGRDERS